MMRSRMHFEIPNAQKCGLGLHTLTFKHERRFVMLFELLTCFNVPATRINKAVARTAKSITNFAAQGSF